MNGLNHSSASGGRPGLETGRRGAPLGRNLVRHVDQKMKMNPVPAVSAITVRGR